MAALRHRIVKKTLVVLNQELNLQLIISTGAEMCKKILCLNNHFLIVKMQMPRLKTFITSWLAFCMLVVSVKF
jgi:hypothetical protein